MRYKGPIIDSDIHHSWKTQDEVIAYLPKQWREFVKPPDRRQGVTFQHGGVSYPHLRGTNKRLETYPADGSPPGSDYELMRRQLLDSHDIKRGILTFPGGSGAALPNPYFGLAMLKAANDWTIDRWLGIGDERLRSSMLVPAHLPEEAAAEIRRIGRHPGIVEALLVWNGLGKPFGYPLYHPIYEAAAEVGIPIAIHFQGLEVDGGLAHTAAGGQPNTRLEFHALSQQPTVHHVASMLVHGVFEKYPTLKLIIVETGITWVAGAIWNLDAQYHHLRQESPWVKRLPSEYFFEHCAITTQPLENTPKNEQLIEYMRAFGGFDEILCFSSDYPHWDADNPLYIANRLPAEWHEKVFFKNALRMYGWTAEEVQATRVPAPLGAAGAAG